MVVLSVVSCDKLLFHINNRILNGCNWSVTLWKCWLAVCRFAANCFKAVSKRGEKTAHDHKVLKT